jgi:hypothetical protein
MNTVRRPFTGALPAMVAASAATNTRPFDQGCDGVDIVVGRAVVGIPGDIKECVLKAGCIAAGEELIGIGRIVPSAKDAGPC